MSPFSVFEQQSTTQKLVYEKKNCSPVFLFGVSLYYPTSNKNKWSRTSNSFQVRACTFEQRTVAAIPSAFHFFFSPSMRSCPSTIMHASSSPTKETCPVGSWPPSGKLAQAVTTTTPERNQSKSSPVGWWPPAGSPGGQGARHHHERLESHTHTHTHTSIW